MAGVKCFLLLLVTVATAVALPSNDRPEEPVVVEAAGGEEPRETFTGFSPSFGHNLPTKEFMGDFLNSDAAHEGSAGFMSGVQENFPSFAALGGFGPFKDLQKDNVAGNFMQVIDFPDVEIGGIKEEQPKFSLPQFPKQLFP